MAEAVSEAAPITAEVKKLIGASSSVGTIYSRSLASIRGFRLNTDVFRGTRKTATGTDRDPRSASSFCNPLSVVLFPVSSFSISAFQLVSISVLSVSVLSVETLMG
jgi:hypothetical protein